ncbi:prolyl 4-hydroxylase subunit alpha-1-like [Drosophila elegans]|uniref:prolyl 4-hydroxylase subunit alpha-1-like n=1 Tax=Drosophila elegans TaxID=30023 RepID=UPI001BC84C51|nr:prolyl 4-hydroxylase subunit alpha-1-like [Drosophila elegans]
MLKYRLLLVGILFLSLSRSQMFELGSEKRYARSVINMDDLLKMEGDLVRNLEKFVDLLSQKARTIRWGIQQMEEVHQTINTGLSEFWANPFSSYSLIRHMQSDWLMWRQYLERPIGLEELAYIVAKNSTMPQKNDFFDAADGITKMQGTYQLLASDIANGLLDGVQYNSSLAAIDCLELGLDQMDQSHLTSAEQWILAGIKAYNRSSNQKEMQLLRGPKKAELYGTLGQVRRELEIFQEYHGLDRDVLNYPETEQTINKQNDEEEAFVRSQLPSCCSGQCEVPRKLRKLYCLYNHVTAPFLRLAPIKTEILSVDPFIVVLHDMVSPKESALLRSSSKKNMIPSSVYHVATKSHEVSTFRLSKFVLYNNSFNEATLKIAERLGDATGLDMNCTEVFQVMNYGLGGFFDTHMDLMLSRKDRFKGKPERMATTLIYLSDVLQGGATLFPKLNLTVFPKSGSALFWYSFNTKGNAEMRTIHTGCPVIVGSKWVVSKWIYDKGQEFRRPCIDSNLNLKNTLSIEKIII